MPSISARRGSSAPGSFLLRGESCVACGGEFSTVLMNEGIPGIKIGCVVICDSIFELVIFPPVFVWGFGGVRVFGWCVERFEVCAVGVLLGRGLFVCSVWDSAFGPLLVLWVGHGWRSTWIFDRGQWSGNQVQREELEGSLVGWLEILGIEVELYWARWRITE